MKFYVQIWLAIYMYSVSVIKGHVENIHFGHRIRTNTKENELGFYVFEMTPMQDVQNCVESCKSKRQCKVINYDHRANLCYHVGFSNSSMVHFNVVDFLEEKPGFSYGDKREWNMTEYQDCENCKEVGVCTDNDDLTLSMCQNSGCRPPDEKSHAFYRGNIFSIGNKIEYECIDGYRTKSTVPLTSTCLENGTWSPREVLCLPEAVFDDNAYGFGNNFYILVFKKMDWQSANDVCDNKKLHLVDIKTQDEQKFIKNITQYIKEYGNHCFWTGGVRQTDDSFSWLDGKPTCDDSEYWEKGQPNNFQENQDCIILKNGKWNDKNCTKKCYAVCELL